MKKQIAILVMLALILIPLSMAKPIEKIEAKNIYDPYCNFMEKDDCLLNLVGIQGKHIIYPDEENYMKHYKVYFAFMNQMYFPVIVVLDADSGNWIFFGVASIGREVLPDVFITQGDGNNRHLILGLKYTGEIK